MNDNLNDHLTRAWNARWNQDQVLWRIFGAFWPTNAILLAALFRSAGDRVPRTYAIVTCAAGVFVALAWSLTQWRAIVNIERLEKTAAKLELEVLGDNAAKKYALSPVLNTEDHKKDRPPLTARRVVPFCILVVGLAWLAGLFISCFCLTVA